MERRIAAHRSHYIHRNIMIKQKSCRKSITCVRKKKRFRYFSKFSTNSFFAYVYLFPQPEGIMSSHSHLQHPDSPYAPATSSQYPLDDLVTPSLTLNCHYCLIHLDISKAAQNKQKNNFFIFCTFKEKKNKNGK